MPGFDTDENLTKLIKTELKDYKDEDMIWIYEEALKENTTRDQQSDVKVRFTDIKHFTQLSEIKDLAINELIKIGDNILLESFFEKIKIGKNRSLKNETLPDLKNNYRLCLFIINYLKNTNIKNNNKIKDLLLEGNSNELLLADRSDDIFYFTPTKNLYIHLIFYLFSEDLEKNNITNAIKEYNYLILKNIKNKSKNLKDSSFIEWAISYLSSYNYDFEEKKYLALNNEDSALLVISFLDFALFDNPYKHEILTTRLYKAWSQKKFRDADKIKTNYHLPLTKDRKEKLKKLAEFHNETESQILEILIEEMYLKKMCDENGKFKY